MSVYLGTIGRMVEIPYATSQSMAAEGRHTFETTLEGRRKSQVRPIARRTWELSSSHFRPQEVALLEQFVTGAWGLGPFQFVPSEAPHTNLLPPTVSTCDPALITATGFIGPGGPAQLPDGSWAARSYLNTSSSINMTFPATIPVMPGQLVTGSAWVRGAGMKVHISFWDAAGNFITNATSSGTGVANAFTRLSATRTAPTNAVRVSVYTSGAGRAANPAVTWTAELRPWSDGLGCEKSVVSTSSREVVLAVPGRTYSNLSFTVTEVG